MTLQQKAKELERITEEVENLIAKAEVAHIQEEWKAEWRPRWMSPRELADELRRILPRQKTEKDSSMRE